MTLNKKAVLYTAHRCPWCRRVHAVLKELGIEVEEVLIDLSVPRPDWYLEINPKGQVPTLVYDGQTIVESGIITQFFADLYPSHLVKATNEEGGALQRAQISLFVAQFLDLAQKPVLLPLFTGSEVTAEAAEKIVGEIAKVLEPQVAAWGGKFFGGAGEVTLAEALTGPFANMILELPVEFGFPAGWKTLLEAKAPKFMEWLVRVSERESVKYLWNKEVSVEAIKAKRPTVTKKT